MPDDQSNGRLYTGSNRLVLDSKHRITIPVSFREKQDESEPFFLRVSDDTRYLDVMPPATFRATSAAILEDPAVSSIERRAVQRLFFSSVEECKTDKQGRLVIPEHFCRAAGLEGELLLAGTGSAMEIWPIGRWEASLPAEKAVAQPFATRRAL